MSEPLIDIRPDHWAIVADILRRHVPDREVWAFGSRATWNAKEYSDLDLAVIGETPLSLSVSAALADDFAESDLPFKVDVVDWATTSEAFRKIIERDKVVVQAGSKNLGMGGEWCTATVAELQRDGILLVEDGNHGEYRPRADEFVDRGIAFIRAADMDAGRVLFESAAKINKRARERITKGIGAPGDVLLSHKGTVGKVALVPDEAPTFVCSPQTTFWRTRDEKHLDRRYLYAFLRSPGFRAQLATREGETDMAPYVSLTSQRGLWVVLPPISEQRAIAHILGTLDDKIELNRRMNETLEAMARALFKSWFVDFDPVRAKMNLPSPPGRGAGGEGTQPSLRTNAPIPTELLDFARKLRRQATDAETLLWRLLRGRQLANAKFRRQYAFPPYILDFYCHELKLAVELDGGQHNEDAGRRRDAQRDEYLAEQGIWVLRFWNNDVLGETEAVLEAIYAAVVEHSNGVPSLPPPLPEGEGSFGIPKPLADLFPARLVDSELGEIPEGWAVGCVDDEFALTMGQSPPGETYNERGEGVPFYQGRADFGARFPTRRVYCTAPTRLAKVGDTLISVRAPVGDINMATENCAIGRGVAAARHRSGSRSYSYQFMLGLEDVFARFEAEGTVFGSIGKKDFHAISCAKPPRAVIAEFEAMLSPVDSRIDVTERKSCTLAALRDTLLPKLISGELRVKDAKRFVAKLA